MKADIEQIRARFAAATVGPWIWKGNTIDKSMTLMAARGWGEIVVDFWRWGMQGAQPYFRTDGLLHQGRMIASQPYKQWDIIAIDHPDAHFIAHSWSDVRDLLEEIDRLNAIIEKD